MKKRKVKNLSTKISQHAKDIIQKHTSNLFKNASLEFYGIQSAPIKELINVELPVIEVKASRTDILFLLEDNSYLHLEFQSAYNKSDLGRFALYDIRLFERDGRLIHTVVIYTSDVQTRPVGLNTGTLSYHPAYVMMGEYNGNQIYAELDAKIKAGEDLSDADMLNLIFLPLMRNTLPREELAVNSIKLAQTISDTTKRNTCIAATFAFAGKYINEDHMNTLLEVLRMTDLATMLVEESMEEKAIEIAKEMLNDSEPITKIIKYTKLDESTIKELQEEMNR